MRILYLEDDEYMARSLLRYGALTGDEYVHVRTTRDALEALHRSRWDVVIADELLEAGERGSAMLRWVAEHAPQTLRILTSGAHQPIQFIEVPPRQMFLPKPFQPADLDRLLRPVRA